MKKILLVLVSVLFIALFTSCGLFNFLFQPWVGTWENTGVGSDQATYKLTAIFTKDSFEHFVYKNGTLIWGMKANFSATSSNEGYMLNGTQTQAYINGQWQPQNETFTAKIYFKGSGKDQIYVSVLMSGQWKDVIKEGSNNAFDYLKKK